jgi:hypothetical protein
MAFLTSRTLATGITLSDLFHIVKPYDISQNPAGSSYKANVQQLFDSISGYCISDLYVTNIHSCSPLNINSLDEGNVYFGSTSGVTIDVINKRIGINTNTPLVELHVSGDTIVSDGLTADTLNISSTPNTDTQLGTEYLTRDSITGEVKIKQIAGPTVYGLFAQTGNSTTVSGTTSELSIIGSGVGSLSVPANGFSVGDSFAVRISGDIGANNGTNLTLRVKSGSVVFGQVGPISMPNVTSSHFSFEITFTIRALGTAGNAQILSSGYFTFTQNAGGSFEGDNFSTLNNTTFDTTVPNTLDVTAQFNSTNSANFIFTELLVLNKIF